jgi:diguanylate cyclase (GGDEF)-like protein/PAS domain S-box-containing protein
LIGELLGTSIHQAVLESLYDAVYVTDRERRILYWNPAAERISGYPRDEVVGRHCSDGILGHVDAGGSSLCHGECPLARAMADGCRRTDEIFLHHKDGHLLPISVRVAPVRDESGEVIGAVEIFSERSNRAATEERLRELEKLAMLDPLTGLPNRRHLEQQLQSRIDEHQRYGWPFGVLLIDVDLFKAVNDTFGHEAGDKVLRLVARTLEANTRAFDVVGRWGGDEFLAILTNVERERIVQIAERFRALVAAVGVPGVEPLQVTLCIGAAAVSSEEDAASILRRADALLYQAKEWGRNRVCS